MSKYIATVEYHVKFEKEIDVYADNIDLAEEKAVGIVEGWNGVVDAEVTKIESE